MLPIVGICRAFHQKNVLISYHVVEVITLSCVLAYPNVEV